MKKYLIAGLLCLIACIACIVLMFWPFSVAEADPPEPPPAPTATPAATSETESESSTSSAEEPAYVSPIDFVALQAENPDIYAWLEIPGTEISYPVLQRSGDDSFYLTHNSDGEEASEGSLFTESAYNGRDFSDPVTVIYGHQMMAGTMFGHLQEHYSDPESFSSKQEILVYTPEATLKYAVFAAVPYDNRHIMYTYNFDSPRMYRAFLDSIFSVRSLGAVFDENIKVTEDDQVLILSTCLMGDPSQRYLVLAKLT